MSTFVKSLAADEDGATAIEYGLIAGLIAVVIIASVTMVGTDVSGMFTTIGVKVAAASPSA
jgi:pilus assembly protein Flp/PilA